VNCGVNYACNSEDSTDNCEEIDHELENVLSGIGKVDADWRDIVVDNEDVFLGLIVSLMLRGHYACLGLYHAKSHIIVVAELGRNDLDEKVRTHLLRHRLCW